MVRDKKTGKTWTRTNSKGGGWSDSKKRTSKRSSRSRGNKTKTSTPKKNNSEPRNIIKKPVTKNNNIYNNLGLASPSQFNKATGISKPKNVNPLTKDLLKKNTFKKEPLIVESSKIKNMRHDRKVKRSGGKIAYTVKEFLPIVNEDSQKTWKKVFNGEKLQNDDYANLLFDVVAFAPGVGGLAGKGLKAGSNLIKFGGRSKKLSLISNPSKKTTFQNSKRLLSFGTSIIKDVGFGKRAFESAKEFYSVDEHKLSQTAKSLGFSGQKELYQTYISTISNKTSNGKWQTDDFTNFIGVDHYNKNSVKQGQKEFLETLKLQGLSPQKALSVIAELEKTRSARVVGQLLGAVRIETSSEKLGRAFIKQGVSKGKAVGIAGAREGISSVATETYLQGGEIKTGDLALALGFAIVGGYKGSQFFSKQVSKTDVKSINAARNKLTNKIYSKLSETKKNKYLNKVLDKAGKGLSVTDRTNIKNKLTKSNKETIIKGYVKKSFAKASSKKLEVKDKLLIRDPIANILDPFEPVGDFIVDMQEKFFKKSIHKKARGVKGIKKVSVKKAKIKSKGVGLSSSNSKSTTKTKSNSSSNSNSNSNSNTKTKVNSKTKTKTKSKTKVSSKTKTKTKVNSKTNTKTKVKTIPVPVLPKKVKTNNKTIPVYDIVKTINGKKVVIKSKVPKNKALKELSVNLAKSKKYKLAHLIPVGKTSTKDTDKPNLKGFQVTKLQGGKISVKKK